MTQLEIKLGQLVLMGRATIDQDGKDCVRVSLDGRHHYYWHNREAITLSEHVGLGRQIERVFAEFDKK